MTKSETIGLGLLLIVLAVGMTAATVFIALGGGKVMIPAVLALLAWAAGVLTLAAARSRG